jgi:hypothetical protein
MLLWQTLFVRFRSRWQCQHIPFRNAGNNFWTDPMLRNRNIVNFRSSWQLQAVISNILLGLSPPRSWHGERPTSLMHFNLWIFLTYNKSNCFCNPQEGLHSFVLSQIQVVGDVKCTWAVASCWCEPVPETWPWGGLMLPNFPCALNSIFKDFWNIGKSFEAKWEFLDENGEGLLGPASSGEKYLLWAFVAHRLNLLYTLRFSNRIPGLRQVSFQAKSHELVSHVI